MYKVTYTAKTSSGMITNTIHVDIADGDFSVLREAVIADAEKQSGPGVSVQSMIIEQE